MRTDPQGNPKVRAKAGERRCGECEYRCPKPAECHHPDARAGWLWMAGRYQSCRADDRACSMLVPLADGTGRQS